jgi:O-antigen/teichoic acid export membrane protein
MAVSLYTSRVILKVLGITDYGIYNLIAGFVTFLSFMSNALVSSMQRYFNVALGKKDEVLYRNVFSMNINILILLSILILGIGETVGLYFLNNYLNIPTDRLSSALLVYHVSIITFIVSLLRSPFQASIIAHERMSFFAYISIAEVLLRLGVVFALLYIDSDRLSTYALLYLGVMVLVDAIYMLFCNKKFPECKYKYVNDFKLFKELTSFSGWAVLGQSSIVIKNQGDAILINRFFTVAANAAMGVASQVTSAVDMFVTNFQTAFSPQLVQTHASGSHDKHLDLLLKSSKYSFFLMLIVSLPIILNIDLCLSLWLEDVPQYTNYFIIFILLSYLLNAISTPLYTSIMATGEIKYYQISISFIYVMGPCLSYLCFINNLMPYYVSIIACFLQLLLLIVRLFYCHKYSKLPYQQFLKKVIIPTFLVSIFLLVLLYAILVVEMYKPLEILTEIVCVFAIIVFIGMSTTERQSLCSIILNKIRK